MYLGSKNVAEEVHDAGATSRLELSKRQGGHGAVHMQLALRWSAQQLTLKSHVPIRGSCALHNMVNS